MNAKELARFAVSMVCLSVVFTAVGMGLKELKAMADHERQQTYNAWVKLSGNPNKLTQAEFESLPQASKAVVIIKETK